MRHNSSSCAPPPPPRRKGGMAEEMRRQELLRQEMALAYKMGDTAKAQRIFERLAPDDPAKKR